MRKCAAVLPDLDHHSIKGQHLQATIIKPLVCFLRPVNAAAKAVVACASPVGSVRPFTLQHGVWRVQTDGVIRYVT